MFRGLADATGKPIYGRFLSGLNGLDTRVGRHYFSSAEARQVARDFDLTLLALCDKEPGQDEIVEVVRNYGRRSGEIWHSMQKNLPDDLGNKR